MRRGLVAALFGALCVVLAFPTVDWVFPVLLAWVPCLLAADGLSWRRRFIVGWLMTGVYQAVIFRWIVFTMQEMSRFPWVAALGCLLLFALWHGLMGGVFLALAEPIRRWVSTRRAWAAPWAIAALYVAVEWLWPMLFPWSLGHAFWRVGPMASTMAWTGPYGLSFVVIGVSASLATFICGRSLRQLAIGLSLPVCILLMGLGWWLHLAQTPPRRTLKVAVIQMNYTLDEKKHANLQMRERLFGRFLDTVESLSPDTYDLVVASEGAFPLFWAVEEQDLAVGKRPSTTSMKATQRVFTSVTRGARVDHIIGGLRRPKGKRTRNSAVHLHGDGRLGGVYDKQILVPFSEYLPGSEFFPSLKNSIPGISDFGHGNSPCRFNVAGEVASCGICYETLFTGYTRDSAEDASLLINLTIDVWFGRSTAPWFHLMAHASRSAELGIPLIRSALTGISALVGADGVPIALLPLDQKGVLVGEVKLKDVKTPYRRIGPLFSWLCLAVSLSLGLAIWRQRRTRNSAVTP